MPNIFVAKSAEKKNKKPVKTPNNPSLKKKGKKKRLSAKPFRERRRRNVHPLLAYSYMPKNVDFVTRESEEKIILLLRRHPITNVGWVLISVAMLFAPAVLNVFPILDFLPERFKFIAVLMWYLITMAFIIENFVSWFFNVNIITDERIIDIDFMNLIYREISEASLDRVQDVTTRMGGVTRAVFNYGDVMIQTAAEVQDIEFLAIPRPDKVAKILRELQVEEETEKIEGRVR